MPSCTRRRIAYAIRSDMMRAPVTTSAIVHKGQRGAAEGVETAIIERYRRSLVEDALIEMYPAGVSARRVEDIIEAFWGCPGVAGDALAAVQKDLRHDRAMARPRDRGRAPVSLS
jgi:hypothetical protein